MKNFRKKFGFFGNDPYLCGVIFKRFNVKLKLIIVL